VIGLRRAPDRPGPLWAVLAAFSLLVLLHGAVTPLFEAPDEIWHYAYVRWLAEGHGLPALDSDASGAHQEVAQPPLYYLVASLLSRPFPDDDLAAVRRHNPNFGYQAPGTVPDNKNMLIHTGREAWPWRGTALTVHVTRLTSWFFGMVTVVAAWGLGTETFRTRRGGLLTAALVAFHPQFVFLSSVVNNDAAGAALATTALWLAARMVRRGAGWRSAATAGLVAGLGIISKVSVLPIVPLLGAVLLWAALRDSRRAGRAAGMLALYLALAAGAGGWWYLRNALRYGDPLGLTSHIQTLWTRPKPASLVELLPELPLLLRSFWGAYGWGHVTWPDPVYVFLWAGALALLVPALRYLVRRLLRAGRAAGRATAKGLPRRLDAALRALGPVALTGWLALVWLGGIGAALVRWMRQVEAPHGRLLFPAIGAWSLLLVLGARRLRARHPAWGHAVIAVLLGSGAVLSALAPGARVLATFAPPRLRDPAAVAAACPAPLDLTYEGAGGTARLLCATVQPDRVAPGDTLAVRACWSAVTPVQVDYTVFVHLLGPEALRVAERHTYPGLGRFPTTLWPVGRAFCETYRLTVAPWADGPRRYHLALGLFDAETGERTSVADGAGRAVEPPVVGAVAVVPPEPAPAGYTASPARLGGPGEAATVRLLGYDVPAAAPGETVTVTLYWEALAALPEAYVAFVHLRQPGDAASSPRLLAQHDDVPRQGGYPTTLWAAGDRVPDAHPLSLPAALPPGRYPLWAGLYRRADGVRLPAYGPEGRYAHDLIPLGTLTVSEPGVAAAP
jgi:hypothetical protein